MAHLTIYSKTAATSTWAISALDLLMHDSLVRLAGTKAASRDDDSSSVCAGRCGASRWTSRCGDRSVVALFGAVGNDVANGAWEENLARPLRAPLPLPPGLARTVPGEAPAASRGEAGASASLQGAAIKARSNADAWVAIGGRLRRGTRMTTMLRGRAPSCVPMLCCTTGGQASLPCTNTPQCQLASG